MVVPRPAASVILLRDGELGPEVFMVERQKSARFVGGAHVFPGGRVDPEDALAAELCTGLDDEAASKRLTVERGGLAHYVAAIRECFEEAGVLLAYDAAGRPLDAARRRAAAAELDEARRALNAREIGFLELARAHGWRLAVDRMHYWSHWITPESSPIRFDTRFFLTTVAPDQGAVHDDGELAGSEWVRRWWRCARPSAASGRSSFRRSRTCGSLLAFATTAEAAEAGAKRGEIAALEPRVLRRPEGIQVVLPGDDGWDEAGDESGARRLDDRAAMPVPGELVRLEPRVRRLTQDNPSMFTAVGTNTHLIGERHVFILDPGPESDAHFDRIVAAVGSATVGRRHPDPPPSRSLAVGAPPGRPLRRADARVLRVRRLRAAAHRGRRRGARLGRGPHARDPHARARSRPSLLPARRCRAAQEAVAR